MNDYELYLVKRAYHKKIAKGITVLGQPIAYDPYDVYNKRKRDMLASIEEPKFLHDNARREQEAAVRRAKNRNLLIGSTIGSILGGAGGYALDTYGGYNKDGRSSKRIPMYLSTTGTGAMLGAGAAALYNKLNKFTKLKDKGWAKGDAVDRQNFYDAQKKYDEDVANATREFNLKYTGMEDPTRDAIYKGGIKLHDEK